MSVMIQRLRRTAPDRTITEVWSHFGWTEFIPDGRIYSLDYARKRRDFLREISLRDESVISYGLRPVRH